MPAKNWRCPVSFDSSRRKQEQAAPAKSTAQAGKRSSARAKRALRATIEEYILDHRSQNHSSKTIEWHTLALGNFAAFLEKKGVTSVEDIERVHILSWLTHLASEPGANVRKLAERSVNCYARSMRAFCNWLEAEGYMQAAPSNHVKMPKVGRPLIRIIEFEELQRMLKACTPQHEGRHVTDRNAARNPGILLMVRD